MSGSLAGAALARPRARSRGRPLLVGLLLAVSACAGPAPLPALTAPADAVTRSPAAAPDPGPAPVAITLPGRPPAAVLPVGRRAAGERFPGQLESVDRQDAAGWYDGGAGVGGPGTVLVAAHVSYGGRPGLFADLDRLHPGDQVLLTPATGPAVGYRVAADPVTVGKTEFPADLVYAPAPLGISRLVLVTCTPAGLDGGQGNVLVTLYAATAN